ncbi:MAG: DnaA regulatory inactivator Hda [Methylophilaceae bacterium]|nr:DnaA regulatory inactivator Hda [Methylophilaceae bacterium]
MKQLLLDIAPPPLPTLDNFVLGCNAEAMHALQAALNGQSSQKFIYLWGENGCGKSHLIQACLAPNIIGVDDVQLLDNEAQILLFNIYNQTREVGGIMIVAGDAAPTQMGLRDDLATRLAWGLVYQLHPLTDAEKALALKNHAFERGMRMPDEVLDYCLRYLRRDLPTLMNTLNALDEWSLTTKKSITVPMLRNLLQLPLNL